METNKVTQPTSQEGLYKAFGTIYEKLMNGEIEVGLADKASKALSGMNRTYALKLKKAEINKSNVKDFDDKA